MDKICFYRDHVGVHNLKARFAGLIENIGQSMASVVRGVSMPKPAQPLEGNEYFMMAKRTTQHEF